MCARARSPNSPCGEFRFPAAAAVRKKENATDSVVINLAKKDASREGYTRTERESSYTKRILSFDIVINPRNAINLSDMIH